MNKLLLQDGDSFISIFQMSVFYMAPSQYSLALLQHTFSYQFKFCIKNFLRITSFLTYSHIQYLKIMQIDQNLTSIKKNTTREITNYFLSPSPQNPLDDQLQQLQLLSQSQITQKLKTKKQQIIKQSQQVLSNCHHYFLDMTSSIIQIENKIKKQIDKQTLDFLQKIDHKIEEIIQNQHSYNCSSQTYQTLKTLHSNFIQSEQNLDEVKRILERCYSATLQGGLAEYGSDIGMSTNKIYLNRSQFNTTNKKVHGNTFEVTEREFELVLVKFQQKEEKLMISNERLKNKVKSLEEVLSKKGVNIKELNKLNSAQNERCSPQYWDLQLQRVKGENLILKEEIGNISNKLIALTSQNEGLKSEYKRMLQSNISQVSNPNNTHSYDIINNMNDNSQLISGMQSQPQMHSQMLIKQVRQDNFQSPSAICISSNFHSNIHNELLIQYEKKNQQLSLQLTKKLKEMEELRQEIAQLAEKSNQIKTGYQQKENQLYKLSNHCATLEHDYEISSKKRFQLQEKINILKTQLKEKQQNSQSSLIQTQLAIDNLQSMLKIKEETILSLTNQIQKKIKAQYESKFQQTADAKQLLEKEMVICRNLMTELKQQNQAKTQKFKEEFKKMQKNISAKDQELVTLREEIYQINRSNQEKGQIQNQENSFTFKQKYENNKKELNKVKKQLKEKTKNYDNLKTQNTKMNELLSYKCSEFNNRIEFVLKEMEKVRGLYQSKLKLIEEKQKVMKQRFEFNMVQLVSQNDGKKANYIELVEKYIETMNCFCAKNAELKKLREQLRQLKSNKSLFSKGSKKEFTKDIDTLALSLEQNNQEITEIQKSLIEDRLKVERKIAEEKLLIVEQQNKLLKQKLNSKEAEIKEIQQDISKLKREVKKSQDSTKKEQLQQANSHNNLLQQKLQKLQAQLKTAKNQYKNSQNELASLQNELKKKRDHISNVKKQLTSHTDQVEQLNFMLKNKNQQIEKLRRQLKDQSTKQVLLNQMKEKMEEFSKLEEANEDLKRQIQKINTSSRFELSKLQNQLKQLKGEKREQLSQKISSKTAELNDELADLKSKNKKLKNQLERKQTILQNIKSKSDNQLKEVQGELAETTKQISQKIKEIQNLDKKIEILTVNQRKYKQRSKLLKVVIQKIYTKILDSPQGKSPKSATTKGNSDTIEKNTSPIAKVFCSNVFNTTATPSVLKQKDNPTLQTLAQLDINLQDLDKYSEGLQMFGVNPFELKSMQTGLYNLNNQNSTFSHFITSPKAKKQPKNSYFGEFISKSPKQNQVSKQFSKEKVECLMKCLSEKEQIDVGSILSIFDEAIENRCQY